MLEEEATRLVSRHKRNVARLDLAVSWVEARLDFAFLVFRTLHSWSSAGELLGILLEAFQVPANPPAWLQPAHSPIWDTSAIVSWRRAISKTVQYVCCCPGGRGAGGSRAGSVAGGPRV